MTNLLFKPVEKAVDFLVEWSHRQLDYIVNYKDHEKKIKELIETLKSHQKKVNEQVKLANDNANDINKDVKDWLRRVDQILGKSKDFHDYKADDDNADNKAEADDDNADIKADDDKATHKSKTSWFHGGCSSGALSLMWHRHQVGQKAKADDDNADNKAEADDDNADNKAKADDDNADNKAADDKATLKSKTSWFHGGCSSEALPSLWHRRQLGWKAKKILAPAIEKLNNEASNYSGIISHPPDLKFGDLNPSDGDYLELESRKGIIEDIMKLLKDSTVNMVGVYGRSGVGKTSLIKKIAEDAGGISKSFDKVILATVKKDPDLQKVQQDIADGLRLTFGNEGDIGRAARLRKSLEQKNVLLILDDLWDKLDLSKIGIPFADDDVSSHVTAKERKDS
ncbi:hypothetical protein PIB30_093208, partial [Stylosanthes scabra]|nr:hypothetical protein [Stylosanthes scabra]